MEEKKSETERLEEKKEELKTNLEEIKDLIGQLNFNLVITVFIVFLVGLVSGYLLGGAYGCR